MRSSHNEDNDERETGAQTSEEDDELCISMFLKNDPKLTVNSYIVLPYLDDSSSLYEEVFRNFAELGSKKVIN